MRPVGIDNGRSVGKLEGSRPDKPEGMGRSVGKPVGRGKGREKGRSRPWLSSAGVGKARAQPAKPRAAMLENFMLKE
jgi:hypothetical protein